MTDVEDIESNLRLFALRRAASEQKDPHQQQQQQHHRVVVTVDAKPNRDCPMHGKNGTFQLPENRPHHNSSTFNPRKEMARELRLLSSSDNMRGHGYNSMPRRTSRQSVDRKSSFQHQDVMLRPKPVPRDVFRGKVDFKTILRRFDPKEDERSHGRRYESEPRDGEFASHSSAFRALPPRRGTIVDSDFDFRPGAVSPREPNWDNPGRFRARSSSNAVYVNQQHHSRSRVHHNLSLDMDHHNNRPFTPEPSYRRPLSAEPHHHHNNNNNNSDPLSPRRVGFGEEIVFDFNPRKVVSPPPSATHAQENHFFKPILRHTASDPTSAVHDLPLSINTGGETNNNNPIDDSLVQIFVPDKEALDVDDDDNDSGDDTSVATLEEIKSDEDSKRVKAPPLADWNRSQSFPPPSTSKPDEKRKQSLPIEDTSSSMRSTNKTLKKRKSNTL